MSIFSPNGCAQWDKIDFGPTVSTYIVKKFRFFAQWDKKNGPKTIFVPLCPLITNIVKKFRFFAQWAKKTVQNLCPTVSTKYCQKVSILCTVGQKKRSKNFFCPTVSTNIVKKFRFCAQWDKKSSPKSTFVPLWTNSCDFALFKINLGFFGQKCSNFAPKN